MTKKNIIDDVFRNKPLLLFSIFSQIQADNLIAIGDDIAKRISRMLRVNGKVGPDFNKTYGYVSLWILGTYELIRTLDQGKSAFKTDTKDNINRYKKKLAQLRVPLAKQELAGKPGVRVSLPLSVYSIDFRKRDLQFRVGENDYYFKELLLDFKLLINSVRRESFVTGL